MTIYNNLLINGSSFIDYKNIEVSKATGDSNYSSNININFDSPYGRHKTDFNVGNTIQLYSNNTGSPINTLLFNGLVERINFSGEETTQEVNLSGKDYTLRLQDLTIQPVVFNNTEISDIVKNILSNNNVPDITTTNVTNTGTTLKRIGFNHTPIFDALNQLVGLTDVPFIWYIDNNKDLHFIPKSSNNSNITLDNSNIVSTTYDQSRQGMANKIWVYGDRYLSSVPTEKYTFGSPVGLSGLTLNYKPHNTQVTYLGSILKGSVLGMTLLTSGVDYGVDFDNRTITFYSGTSIGYSAIPVSGGSVLVNYDRDLPIVKYGQDDLSISLYGPKNLKIQDNNIKDPQTALDILKQNLENSNPLNRVEIFAKGFFNPNPSDYLTANLTDFNLTQNLDIIETRYKFDKDSIQSEKATTFILNKKLLDITDKIKQVDNRLNKLEAQNLSSSDIYTRLFQSSDTVTPVGSNWNVYTRKIGNSFILSHPINGKLGSQTFQPYLGLMMSWFKLDTIFGRLDYQYLLANAGGYILFQSGL